MDSDSDSDSFIQQVKIQINAQIKYGLQFYTSNRINYIVKNLSRRLPNGSLRTAEKAATLKSHCRFKMLKMEKGK